MVGSSHGLVEVLVYMVWLSGGVLDYGLTSSSFTGAVQASTSTDMKQR